MNKQLDEALLPYIEHIRADYSNFSHKPVEDQEFDIEIEEGSKYVKVISGSHGHRGVHSFIVKEDRPAKGKTKGFKAGDILKAASWAAPATNFSRGNVFSGRDSYKTRVHWTGVG
jgi:hypothetical protein